MKSNPEPRALNLNNLALTNLSAEQQDLYLGIVDLAKGHLHPEKAIEFLGLLGLMTKQYAWLQLCIRQEELLRKTNVKAI